MIPLFYGPGIRRYDKTEHQLVDRMTVTMMKKLLVLICTIALSALAMAQGSGGDFEMRSSTIDSGGGVSSGGGFSLTGTIGQHDASESVQAGGEFLLAGGFWGQANSRIFADGFEGP